MSKGRTLQYGLYGAGQLSSPILEEGDQIIIREAHVSIHPVTRIEYTKKPTRSASKKAFVKPFPETLNQGADGPQGKVKILKRNEKHNDISSLDSANEGIRTSLDFFKQPQTAHAAPGLAIQTQSSLVINKDEHAGKDDPRKTQSMTLVGKLLQKTPSKLQDRRNELVRKNQEYQLLSDEFKLNCNTLSVQERENLSARLENVKSQLRNTVKDVMLEQRRNKNEKFEPIEIALVDDLQGIY